MEPTKLQYFEEPWAYQAAARVVKVDDWESEGRYIILDQTIFYPQGGGQPYDNGTITNGSVTFEVREVRFLDGQVFHIGEFKQDDQNESPSGEAKKEFQPGEEVTCTVDEPRRKLNSRLHSGGHLVDYALENLGYSWEPTKGVHFPDGPYVEYKADTSEEERAKLIPKLEAELNRLVAKGAPVTMKIMPREELEKICTFVPDYLPQGKPSRGAIFHFTPEDGGERGIPCGGTHVKNLSEIGAMSIPKIRTKKGITRISYRCE